MSTCLCNSDVLSFRRRLRATSSWRPRNKHRYGIRPRQNPNLPFRCASSIYFRAFLLGSHFQSIYGISRSRHTCFPFPRIINSRNYYFYLVLSLYIDFTCELIKIISLGLKISLGLSIKKLYTRTQISRYFDLNLSSVKT